MSPLKTDGEPQLLGGSQSLVAQMQSLTLRDGDTDADGKEGGVGSQTLDLESLEEGPFKELCDRVGKAFGAFGQEDFLRLCKGIARDQEIGTWYDAMDNEGLENLAGRWAQKLKMVEGTSHAQSVTQTLYVFLKGSGIPAFAGDLSCIAANSALVLSSQGGQGSFGSTQILWVQQKAEALGHICLVKAFDPSKTDEEAVQGEAVKLRQMSQDTNGAVPDVLGYEGHCIFMKYVAGETLRERLRKYHLDFSEIIDIAQQLAKAIKIWTDQGFVHRDLKPANIIINPDPRGGFRVSVVDLGMASDVVSAERGISGTPNYMAPEQIDSRWTETTDLYALTLILMEMATGENPQAVFTQSDIRNHNFDISALASSITADHGKAASGALINLFETFVMEEGDPRPGVDLFLENLDRLALHKPAPLDRSRVVKVAGWTSVAVALALLLPRLFDMEDRSSVRAEGVIGVAALEPPEASLPSSNVSVALQSVTLEGHQASFKLPQTLDFTLPGGEECHFDFTKVRRWYQVGESTFMIPLIPWKWDHPECQKMYQAMGLLTPEMMALQPGETPQARSNRLAGLFNTKGLRPYFIVSQDEKGRVCPRFTTSSGIGLNIDPVGEVLSSRVDQVYRVDWEGDHPLADSVCRDLGSGDLWVWDMKGEALVRNPEAVPPALLSDQVRKWAPPMGLQTASLE